MSFHYFRHLVYQLFIIGLLVGCAPRDPSQSPAAKQLVEFTGFPTKITWVEDTGDPIGGDYPGTRRYHRLMVLATAEGAEPRILIDGPDRNFYRPQISSCGEWVVFSDHGQHTMHKVPFAGGDEVSLGDGRVLSVRWDEESGVDWLYFMVRETEERHKLFRKELRENAPEPELLWQTERFTLGSVSADGRMVMGQFGWPHVGMIDLETRRMRALPDGCWPDISPDNRYLGWIFEGTHNSVRMIDLLEPDTHWRVVLNTHPEVAAGRIYHPHWGNHPQFVVFNGPFRGQFWEHRNEVELYLVRLDPGLRRVEDTLRITYNVVKDMMPYVWVDHGIQWPAAGEARRAAMEASADVWPADHEHLVNLWKRQEADNGFTNVLTGVSSIGSVQARGLGRFSRRGMMDLSIGWFEAAFPSEALAQAIVPSAVVAFEFVVHGAPADHSHDGILLDVHSEDGGSDRLQVRWRGNDLVAVARQGDKEHLLLKDKMPPTNRAYRHILVQISDFHMQVIVDGQLILFPEIGGRTRPLSSWNSIRATYGGGNGLPVKLSHAAIHKNFMRGDAVGEAASAALLSAGRTGEVAPPALRVRAELVDVSPTPSPEGIAPYRRALISAVYRIEEVLEGEYPEQEIMVQHWAIMDGELRPDAVRSIGEVYEMRVEPVEANPQLRSEYTVMDVENLFLEPYYQTDF